MNRHMGARAQSTTATAAAVWIAVAVGAMLAGGVPVPVPEMAAQPAVQPAEDGPPESAVSAAEAHRQFMQRVAAVTVWQRETEAANRHPQTSADADPPVDGADPPQTAAEREAEWQRRVESAVKAGAQFLAVAEPNGGRSWRETADARVLLAQLELLRADPDAAAGWVEPVTRLSRPAEVADGAGFGYPTPSEVERVMVQALVLQVIAHRQAGRLDRAKAALDRLVVLDRDQARNLAPELVPRIVEGMGAPDFSVRESEWAGDRLRLGKTLTLSDFSGRVGVLLFWRSDVPAAVARLRELAALVERVADARVKIIGVNLDPLPDRLRLWLATRAPEANFAPDGSGVSAPAELDGWVVPCPLWPQIHEGGVPAVADDPSRWLRVRYACHVVPTVVVIDHRQKIARVVAGSGPIAPIEQAVTEILKSMSGG